VVRAPLAAASQRANSPEHAWRSPRLATVPSVFISFRSRRPPPVYGKNPAALRSLSKAPPAPPSAKSGGKLFLNDQELLFCYEVKQ
jgi:hypothetical protein